MHRFDASNTHAISKEYISKFLFHFKKKNNNKLIRLSRKMSKCNKLKYSESYKSIVVTNYSEV